VVTDDESRENEGDLIMAGELADADTVGFIVRHSSGVICVAIPAERAVELQLPPMYANNEDPKGTAFTVSTDLKVGTTTGISGGDRAATFRALADPATGPGDLNRPGHVFPLVARPGGVLERDGHTEAALDFCRLAGLKPAGVLCEVRETAAMRQHARRLLLRGVSPRAHEHMARARVW
jgi:3,4-dihydroxy-2-butanone 4-phosphate synthase